MTPARITADIGQNGVRAYYRHNTAHVQAITARTSAEECWSLGANDPTLMGWWDKACIEAHIATAHLKQAEDRLKREKMLIESAKEWHFYRVIDGPQGRGDK